MYIPYLMISLLIIAIIIYDLLGQNKAERGNFKDWAVIIAMGTWLLSVVSIPWDIFSDALKINAEHKAKRIQLTLRQERTLKTIFTWSLVVAIGLHFLTAVVFYVLYVYGLVPIGAIFAMAALLTIFVRPMIEIYCYISTVLSNMQKTKK